MGHQQEEPVVPVEISEEYHRQQQQLAVPQVVPLYASSSETVDGEDGKTIVEDGYATPVGEDDDSRSTTTKISTQNHEKTQSKDNLDFPPARVPTVQRSDTRATAVTSMYAEEEAKRIDDVGKPDHPQRLWRW